MDSKVKRLWLKALRSGKYKQGKGQLCTEIGNEKFHCCLGVLEEVAVSAGVIDSYNGGYALLDRPVCAWAGLTYTNPKLGPRRDSPLAATLNDTGASFDLIADRIEKYL